MPSVGAHARFGSEIAPTSLLAAKTSRRARWMSKTMMPACSSCSEETLTAQVWELLRMLALWGVRSRPGLASNRTSEQLCRIYLGLGLGLLQPFFMLLALLLCQSTLRWGRMHVKNCGHIHCVPACRHARQFFSMQPCKFAGTSEVLALTEALSAKRAMCPAGLVPSIPDPTSCGHPCSAGKRRRQEGRTAAGILGLAALGTAPLAAVQVVLAWFSQIFKSHSEPLAPDFALASYCMRTRTGIGQCRTCWRVGVSQLV